MTKESTQPPLQKANELIEKFGGHNSAIQACKIAIQANMALSILIDKKLKLRKDKYAYNSTVNEMESANLYWGQVILNIEEKRHNEPKCAHDCGEIFKGVSKCNKCGKFNC